MDSFSSSFLDETIAILRALDAQAIEDCALELAAVRRRRGRLFVLGVGGSAGHASHAVSDFRKLCGVEAYCPTDNVCELTARTNDEGWASSLSGWLATSNLNDGDGILVFSVGGGDVDRGISVNLVEAIKLAEDRHASTLAVVGRDGGYAAAHTKAHILIPPLFGDHVTAQTEGVCAVIWHLLVSHPVLAKSSAKWESV